jgi:phage terminase large subunit-like protein
LDLGATIGAFLRELYRGYWLEEVRYDPYQMVELATRLRAEGLPMVEYPQSVPNLTAMGQNLYELIQAQNIRLYPDAMMRTCASHASAVQSSRGWRIGKEKTSFKIDVIVALAMASLVAIEKGDQRLQIYL